MATISPSPNGAYKASVVTWTPIATGDTINAYEVAGATGALAAVQFTGTFGGATVNLQGSNDGSSWFELSTPSGTAVSTTASALFEVSTAVLFLRPSISGGSGDAVTVVLALRQA